MYEALVKGVAGIGSKKNKIIVCVIIGVCVALCAFLIPVQTYAMGNLLTMLVGTLAGLMASTAAGPAVAATVAAAGIAMPELAAFLLCAFLAAGVSCGVTMICDAFMFWWKNGGSADTLLFFADCWDGAKNMISAAPAKFAKLVDWVKYDLLRLKVPSGDVSDLSFPQGEYVDTVHVNSTSKPDFSYDYENHGFKYTFSSDIFRANGCFSPRLNILMRPKNNEHLGVRLFFGANFSYNNSSYDSDYKLYEPVFTAGNDGVISSITDHVYVTRGGNVHTDRSAATTEATYIVYSLANKNKDYIVQLRYNSNDKQVTYTAPTTRHLILTLSDGSTKENFNSINEFLTDYLYNSIAVTDSDNLYPSVSGLVQSESEAAQYYNADKDVISAVGTIINKKITAGDIDDDTDGVVSVGMVGTAAAEIAGVADAALGDVAITDVAIPTQVTADKAATDAGVKVPGNISNAFSLAGNAIMNGAATIGDKFPFDVIKSAYSWLQTLVQPGKPLVIDFDYDLPTVGLTHVHLDYSDRQKEVDIINWLCIVMTALGCFLVTRDQLKKI